MLRPIRTRKKFSWGWENERTKLRLVEEALAKIDEGTYGACERCEEAIPVKRLDPPFTRYCVQCQTELERESAAL